MTSKGFFGLPKTGGKGRMRSDLTISYVSSGLGLAPFTGAKGGIFWGEGSEVLFQGIYSFPMGARGGRCACDIIWFVVQRYAVVSVGSTHLLYIVESTVVSQDWIHQLSLISSCQTSLDNSWTTENSGPCFQPKRQKRPRNSRNHHLGWVLIWVNEPDRKSSLAG